MDYDAESYIRLLSTFSGHIAMAPESRERLFTEIRRRLSQRADGRVRTRNRFRLRRITVRQP